jgi:hypothetical protein
MEDERPHVVFYFRAAGEKVPKLSASQLLLHHSNKLASGRSGWALFCAQALFQSMIRRIKRLVDVNPFVHIHINHRMVAGSLHYVDSEGGISWVMQKK